MRTLALLATLCAGALAPVGASAQSGTSGARSALQGVEYVSISQKVRRLRIAGWTIIGVSLLAAGGELTAAALLQGESDDDYSRGIRLAIFGTIFTSAVLVAGAATLLRARLILNRDRARRELSIGLSPTAICLWYAY